MKKLVCFVTAAIVLLAFCPAAFSGANDYAGTWTNTDQQTKGITKLVIAAASSTQRSTTAQTTGGATAVGSRTIKKPKGNIKIIYPNGGEVWAQGNRYYIHYETKGNVGYVSIALKNTATNQQYTVLARWNAIKVPIPGTRKLYDPPVPCNVTKNIPPGKYKVRMATLDGSDWDESNRAFTIRGPVDVDLVCDIRDAKGNPMKKGAYLKVSGFGGFMAIKPHIWAKNNGTKRLKHVLIDYRVLKLPQKLLIVQDGVGFGDMYPGTWYNGQLKIDLRKELQKRGIKNWKGKYVLEAVVDPQNQHRENEEYRSDNTDEFFFEIR
ncbi:MAG: hypothetical protein JXC33_04330 [Deltaproteobacteria bacterium]|nr:hypothetical protein [Deltaproteobacteria bacterium]